MLLLLLYSRLASARGYSETCFSEPSELRMRLRFEDCLSNQNVAASARYEVEAAQEVSALEDDIWFAIRQPAK